jgi:hypothetical protein
MPVRLDLNNPHFQVAWFGLEKNQSLAILRTFRKLLRLEWEDVYRDAGLKWENIQSRRGASGERLYTIRVSDGFRAVVNREGETMRFMELHPDHDGAYR